MVFLTAKWLLRHTGSSGFARVFDCDLYRRTQACFVCSTTHGLTLLSCYLGLLFWGLRHWIYLCAPCLVFRIHVTGNLGKLETFVQCFVCNSIAVFRFDLLHCRKRTVTDVCAIKQFLLQNLSLLTNSQNFSEV